VRALAPTFVAAWPSGARIRTRLRVTLADAAVLRAVGGHLGSLAGQDLAVRCRLGLLPDDQRAGRKRALTVASSSRWAGAVTRTSNDQWRRGWRNLQDVQVGLARAIGRITARLAVPVGQRHGRVRGYASRAERWAKQQRLQRLRARHAEVEARLAAGRVSLVRGGRRLAKQRQRLDQAVLTREQWRVRWEAQRWFLAADGEAGKAWGNETIRVHPDQGWLELRLPSALAYLSNTPGRAPTYRLGCPVVFSYRAGDWAAQTASGAVRYDLAFDPAKGQGRWYLDASWQLPPVPPPALVALRAQRALGVDLNADHLAAWVLSPSGSPLGPPVTILLHLDSQPAATRDGRLRAAISTLLHLASEHGCRSIVVENLDFADARRTGRETLGRGRRGRRLRRVIAGIPTRRFRDLLVGMAANHNLWVVAVDPAWTSKWGQRHWQPPLAEETRRSTSVTRHHAAAVVIGRRGLGLGARRRPGVPRPHRRMGTGELPTRPDQRAWGREGRGPPGGQWAAATPRKTRPAERTRLGDQVTHDRSVPPASADKR
jgi:hypothetical protein